MYRARLLADFIVRRKLVVIPLTIALVFSLALVALARPSGPEPLAAATPSIPLGPGQLTAAVADLPPAPDAYAPAPSSPAARTPGPGSPRDEPARRERKPGRDRASAQDSAGSADQPHAPAQPAPTPQARPTVPTSPGSEPTFPDAEDPAPTSSPDTAPPSNAAGASRDKPNVLIILTDDQRGGTEVAMPTVVREVIAKGVSFPNAVVPTSWCCPSRSSLLTGKYSHGTGVWDNNTRVSYGGWPAFSRLGNESRTLATALKREGYTTGLFGKYLNGLEKAPRGYQAPGWDRFEAMAGSGNGYTEFPTVDGVRHKNTYSTDYFAQEAEDFIRSAPDSEPVFAYFAPFAPHSPYTAGPYKGKGRARLADMLAHIRWPGPAVGTQGVEDMAPWLSRWAGIDYEDRTGLSPAGIAAAQLDTLMGVDAAVKRLLRALEETGRLENTLVVFMSDNGYSWGEHGLTGKNTPYRSSIEVPLAIRWDARGLSPGSDYRAAAANIDVTATILAAARAELPGVDGVSLLTRQPGRDGVLLEATRWHGIRKRPAYCGWRSPQAMYVRYSGGFEEMYDYTVDPFEETNVAADPAYSDMLEDMRKKARLGCFPPPPDFSWDGPDSVAQATP